MNNSRNLSKPVGVVFLCLGALALTISAQQTPPNPSAADTIDQAQRPRSPAIQRPEQTKTQHDSAPMFDAGSAKPASTVANDQPNSGKITGFDFYRDPLNADYPNLKPEEIVRKESAQKPRI